MNDVTQNYRAVFISDAHLGFKGAKARHLANFLESHHSDHLYLSAVTVTEIVRGIAKQERTGAVARAARLRDWLDLLLHLYDARVLHFDVAAARLAGELSDRAQASGHTPGFADIAIAATAASRGLTVLTRNLRHFDPLGIAAIDPFEELP